MKRLGNLETLSTEELVDLFVAICTEMGAASARFETRKFNRLFDKKSAVVRELRSRPGDQRHALFALYGHSNLQVRLTTANNTYALNPEAAKNELRAIQATNWAPQGPDAGMSLSALEMGISKLPEDPWI